MIYCDACGSLMCEPAAQDDETGIAVCQDCVERGEEDRFPITAEVTDISDYGRKFLEV